MGTLQLLRADQLLGSKHVRINANLQEFPIELIDLASSLEHLDLSGNSLSALPDEFAQLTRLKILFLSDNNFKVFPSVLGRMPMLEMVAFKNNGMLSIPDDAIPIRLKWLILTNNLLEVLPVSLGSAYRLEKVMLSGNRLVALPQELCNLKRLRLLRLSSNLFEEIPEWLFELPELTFLAFAGNPCVMNLPSTSRLPSIKWSSLTLIEQLGEGASGVIWKAHFVKDDASVTAVAIKIFKGRITSDGAPEDEFESCIRAGNHPSLIYVLGRIVDHPQSKIGLVLQLIPANYEILGLPPSLTTCSRDCFRSGQSLEATQAIKILQIVADGLKHLHSLRISHGDLYAHNIFVNDCGLAYLGDFGAATSYESLVNGRSIDMERVEVKAFGFLVEDVLNLVKTSAPMIDLRITDQLLALSSICLNNEIRRRPNFTEIHTALQTLAQSVLL